MAANKDAPGLCSVISSGPCCADIQKPQLRYAAGYQGDGAGMALNVVFDEGLEAGRLSCSRDVPSIDVRRDVALWKATSSKTKQVPASGIGRGAWLDQALRQANDARCGG